MSITPDILCGWEIECVINLAHITEDDFMRQISLIHPDIDIGDDGSLSPNPETSMLNPSCYELRTPAQPVKESIITLQKILDLVQKYGYCNKKCGIHLNISTIDEEKHRKFDCRTFALNPMWVKIGKQFNRNRNVYCKNPLVKIKKFRGNKRRQKLIKLCEVILNGKYNYISYRSFSTYQWSPRNRVEVRIMGGNNYHKKFDLIKRNTLKIAKLFNLATEKNIDISKDKISI